MHHLWCLLSQTCADPKTRLPLLAEKGMETAIKYINKKFPNIDFRGNIVSGNDFASFAPPSTHFSLSILLCDISFKKMSLTYF